MNFNTEADEQVEVQMGVSFVSMANARENLDAEQRGKNFDAIRAEARAKWNDDLSRILVEGGTKTERHYLLYSSLSRPYPPKYPAGCQRTVPCHGG